MKTMFSISSYLLIFLFTTIVPSLQLNTRIKTSLSYTEADCSASSPNKTLDLDIFKPLNLISVPFTDLGIKPLISSSTGLLISIEVVGKVNPSLNSLYRAHAPPFSRA